MPTRKAIQSDSAAGPARNATEPPKWRRSTYARVLALMVIAVGVTGLMFAWATGWWLPPIAHEGATQGQLQASPEQVSERVLASLPLAVQQQIRGWNHMISTNFAGDEACAECHQDEYEAHLRSGHSQTAVLMNGSSLAGKLTEQKRYEDPRRDQVFEFLASNGQFVVRDGDSPQDAFVPVTWLLGSGTHAQTPIAVDEATQRGVELRWSYFPSQNRVGLTPDHERYDDFAQRTIECFGRPMDDADLRACLGCHSTMMPPPSLPVLNSMVIANVGCERCHGPRKKHVELAHLGRAEEAKPLLQYETAADYMAACATCHRDASSVTPDVSPQKAARFQPYGIQRSRCYLETPGNITCSTCHDPHDTVSQDRASSIDQCHQCHQQGASSTCTHQPGGDCIDCHMPLVPWTSGIAFHDHWIRVPESETTDDGGTHRVKSESTENGSRSP
ncbi:multiheme c-type cytochrome [Allorhodopirellula solitaria]|uniref:Cytochrome c-552/4 domain-containing protein n=1 Tax=Allorhodopirellula solitaria TaxID=2527987 RepID=A0A5C5YF87_9BACT|nr:multiheme c-type cytochrome [Allorhodopirellula solitaria]TWT73005.1 hypothetical protein CA85_14660 [Allorhodopirellula solitaria]